MKDIKQTYILNKEELIIHIADAEMLNCIASEKRKRSNDNVLHDATPLDKESDVNSKDSKYNNIKKNSGKGGLFADIVNCCRSNNK